MMRTSLLCCGEILAAGWRGWHVQPGGAGTIQALGSARDEASRFAIRHHVFRLAEKLQTHQQRRWMIDQQRTEVKAKLREEVHIVQFVGDMQCRPVALKR